MLQLSSHANTVRPSVNRIYPRPYGAGRSDRSYGTYGTARRTRPSRYSRSNRSCGSNRRNRPYRTARTTRYSRSDRSRGSNRSNRRNRTARSARRSGHSRTCRRTLCKRRHSIGSDRSDNPDNFDGNHTHHHDDGCKQRSNPSRRHLYRHLRRNGNCRHRNRNYVRTTLCQRRRDCNGNHKRRSKSHGIRKREQNHRLQRYCRNDLVHSQCVNRHDKFHRRKYHSAMVGVKGRRIKAQKTAHGAHDGENRAHRRERTNIQIGVLYTQKARVKRAFCNTYFRFSLILC